MKSILKLLISIKRLLIRGKKPIKTHHISTKNKWLYPEDSFGKLERGVEYD